MDRLHVRSQSTQLSFLDKSSSYSNKKLQGVPNGKEKQSQMRQASTQTKLGCGTGVGIPRQGI
jgi:hypothetical protein